MDSMTLPDTPCLLGLQEEEAGLCALALQRGLTGTRTLHPEPCDFLQGLQPGRGCRSAAAPKPPAPKPHGFLGMEGLQPGPRAPALQLVQLWSKGCPPPVAVPPTVATGVGAVPPTMAGISACQFLPALSVLSSPWLFLVK